MQNTIYEIVRSYLHRFKWRRIGRIVKAFDNIMSSTVGNFTFFYFLPGSIKRNTTQKADLVDSDCPRNFCQCK